MSVAKRQREQTKRDRQQLKAGKRGQRGPDSRAPQLDSQGPDSQPDVDPANDPREPV